MTRSWQRLVLCFFVLAWLVSVLILYYAGHKPFSPQFVLNIAKAAGQLIAALMIVAVGGGVGRLLLPTSQLRLSTMMVLQASLGLGLLSLIVLAIGSTLGINPIIGWIGLAILGILLWRHVLDWLGSLRSAPGLWKEASFAGRIIIVGAILLAAVSLLVALSPPVKFDSLVYHLALPRAYLDQGRIIYIPQSMFWGMPQTGEMLYTWAMSLASTEAATLLCWLTGLLAMLGVVSYVSERLGNRAGFISLATLLSVFTLTALLPTGYIDWLVVLFGISFMVMMEAWWSTRSSKSLVLAGVFAGFALATKYTAGILLIAGITILLIHALRKANDDSHPVSDFIYFVLPVFIITLPWWIKNILATGNPFYPFFIPSGEMDQFRLNFYQLPRWGNWIESILLPIRATVTGYEGSPGYSATIGPLLLALCPFAFLGWRERVAGQRITILISTIIGLSGLIVWGVGSRLSGYLIQSRLYFAVFPALSLLAGAGFDGIYVLKLPGIRIGRVAGILILLVLGFTVIQTLNDVIARGPARVLLGISTPDSYLSDNLGWYYPATKAINELPTNSHVLMLWEPRGFYCQPKCVADEVLDRWKHDRQIWHDPDAILASWRNAGFTHLLFNKFGAQFDQTGDTRYDPSDWKTLEELLSNLKQPEDFGGAYQLYPLQ